MKTRIFNVKFILAITVLSFGLMTSVFAINIAKSDNSYKDVVKHLNELIESTPNFKSDIEAALKSQDNCSYYWDGKDIKYFLSFFEEWLVYNPVPWDGAKYIQPFDELANSEGGTILFNNNIFSSWFISFLDARGAYLKTGQSLTKEQLKEWKQFKGIDLNKYKPYKYNGPLDKRYENYKSFNDVFLREFVKPIKIASPKKNTVLVSPAAGKIHQIYANNLTTKFEIKKDVINIRQALNNSEYAERFIGGKMVDILLWFTDYHHFHSPVSGTVVEMNGYAGSYNYNFKNVDWYKELAKHKRLCYIIESEEFGLVAMIPVGFWGVGSIKSIVKEGQVVKKGQKIGNFGFGGSSILLIFEPDKIDFSILNIESKWVNIKVGEKIGNTPNKIFSKNHQ
jgi:phosphatidylserine decarboxylase